MSDKEQHRVTAGGATKKKAPLPEPAQNSGGPASKYARASEKSGRKVPPRVAPTPRRSTASSIVLPGTSPCGSTGTNASSASSADRKPLLRSAVNPRASPSPSNVPNGAQIKRSQPTPIVRAVKKPATDAGNKYQSLRSGGPASDGIAHGSSSLVPAGTAGGSNAAGTLKARVVHQNKPVLSRIQRHSIGARLAEPNNNSTALVDVSPSSRASPQPTSSKAVSQPKGLVNGTNHVKTTVDGSRRIPAPQLVSQCQNLQQVALQSLIPLPAVQIALPDPIVEELAIARCVACDENQTKVSRLLKDLRHAASAAQAFGVVIQHFSHSNDGMAASELRRRLVSRESQLKKAADSGALLEAEIRRRALEHEAIVKRVEDLRRELMERCNDIKVLAEEKVKTEELVHRAEKEISERTNEVNTLKTLLHESGAEKEALKAEVQTLKVAEGARKSKEARDATVRAANERCLHLENEISSLRSVGEMRMAELNALRQERNLFIRREEELRHSQELAKRLQLELEDVRTKLTSKERLEREWALERQQLTEHNTRLSAEKNGLLLELDMLRWKVQNKDAFQSHEGSCNGMTNGNGSGSRCGTPSDALPPSPFLAKKSNSFRQQSTPLSWGNSGKSACGKDSGSRPNDLPSLSKRTNTRGLQLSRMPSGEDHGNGSSNKAQTPPDERFLNRANAMDYDSSPPSSQPSSPNGMKVITEKEASVSFIVSFDELDALARRNSFCSPRGTPLPSPSTHKTIVEGVSTANRALHSSQSVPHDALESPHQNGSGRFDSLRRRPKLEHSASSERTPRMAYIPKARKSLTNGDHGDPKEGAKTAGTDDDADSANPSSSSSTSSPTDERPPSRARSRSGTGIAFTFDADFKKKMIVRTADL